MSEQMIITKQNLKKNEENVREQFSDYIRIMKKLSEYIGGNQLIEMIKRANDETILPNESSDPNLDFLKWNARNDEIYKDIASWEVIEDTDEIHKLKVNECLFAKIFREQDAGELGHVTICRNGDLLAKKDHTSISFSKTKSLMKGDSYCDSCWTFSK